MLYKARKQGNSIAITIPQYIIKMLEIKDGDKMAINLQGKKIIIKKD